MVEELDLGRREHAHVVRQLRLWEADEFVAVDAAGVLQAFVFPDGNLGGQSVMQRVDRSADNGGEARINHHLPAYDDKHA